MSENIMDKYRAKAKEFAANWKVEDNHVINICASVMMTRDSVLQGGGFVQAIIDNNLYEAVNRADDTCIKHLKLFVVAKRNWYI